MEQLEKQKYYTEYIARIYVNRLNSSNQDPFPERQFQLSFSYLSNDATQERKIKSNHSFPLGRNNKPKAFIGTQFMPQINKQVMRTIIFLLSYSPRRKHKEIFIFRL